MPDIKKNLLPNNLRGLLCLLPLLLCVCVQMPENCGDGLPPVSEGCREMIGDNHPPDATPPPGGGSHFNPNITYGSFTDSRDNKTYKYVTIGSQTWMAENLNYAASGSVCYDSCAKYGRLYNWYTVMIGFPSSSSNPSGVQGICPSGWHVPSDAEWKTLVGFVDPNATGDFYNNAGTKLKAKSGWCNNGNDTDDYGFSALPGGYGDGFVFDYLGYGGVWWSATKDGANYAWCSVIACDNSAVIRGGCYQTFLLSLRCVRDVWDGPRP